MIANAILVFFTAVMLCIFNPFSGVLSVTPREDTIAANYITYRMAVIAYVEDHSSFVGEADMSDLSLPSGFKELNAWRNYIDATAIYVYGPYDPGVLLEISERLDGTRLFGISDSGNLVSPLYGNVETLPSWCEDSVIISMVKR